jgi:hypothetical protein
MEGNLRAPRFHNARGVVGGFVFSMGTWWRGVQDVYVIEGEPSVLFPAG